MTNLQAALGLAQLERLAITETQQVRVGDVPRIARHPWAGALHIVDDLACQAGSQDDGVNRGVANRWPRRWSSG